MPIHFITDQQPGEPDTLADCRHDSLHITDLDGTPICTVAAPTEGWDHWALCQLGVDPVLLRDGADAYLGSTWVGSTEV